MFRAVGPQQCSAAQQKTYQTTHTIHKHLLDYPTCTHTPRAGQAYPHTTPLAYHTNTHSHIRCNTHKHTYLHTHAPHTHKHSHAVLNICSAEQCSAEFMCLGAYYAPKHINSYPNTVTHIQTQHTNTNTTYCTYARILSHAHTQHLWTLVWQTRMVILNTCTPTNDIRNTYNTQQMKCTDAHIRTTLSWDYTCTPTPHIDTHTHPYMHPFTHPYTYTRAQHTEIHNASIPLWWRAETNSIAEDTYFAELQSSLRERPLAAGLGLGG